MDSDWGDVLNLLKVDAKCGVLAGNDRDRRLPVVLEAVLEIGERLVFLNRLRDLDGVDQGRLADIQVGDPGLVGRPGDVNRGDRLSLGAVTLI